MKILEVLIVKKNENNDRNPMQGKYDSETKNMEQLYEERFTARNVKPFREELHILGKEPLNI